MIKISNLVFSYPHRRKKLAVDNLLIDGNITLITGDSGSFKSTLVKLIAKRLRLRKGKIENDDDVFYLDQNFSFVEEWTCRENLKEAGCLDFENIARELNIDGLLDYEVSTLSTGQRARLAIVFALCQKERLIVLDEPTRNLDKDNIKLLEKLILSFSSYKKFIVITHANDFLNDDYDLFLKLENGRIIEEKRKDIKVVSSNKQIVMKKQIKISRHLIDRVFTLISVVFAMVFGVLLALSNNAVSYSTYEDSVYTFRRNVNGNYERIQYEVIPDFKIDFSLENRSLPDYLTHGQMQSVFTSYQITFSDDVRKGTFGLSSDAFDYIYYSEGFSNINHYYEMDMTLLNINDKQFVYSSYDLKAMTFVLNTDDYLQVMYNYFYKRNSLSDNELGDFEVILSADAAESINFSYHKEVKVGDRIGLNDNGSYSLDGRYVIKEIRDDLDASDIRSRYNLTSILFRSAITQTSSDICFSSIYSSKVSELSNVFSRLLSSPEVKVGIGNISNQSVVFLVSYTILIITCSIFYYFYSCQDDYEKNIQRFYKQSKLSLWQYLKKKSIEKRIYGAPLTFLLITLLRFIVVFIYGDFSIIYLINSLILLITSSLIWIIVFIIYNMFFYYRKTQNIE